jgi:hypothetical protein
MIKVFVSRNWEFVRENPPVQGEQFRIGPWVGKARWVTKHFVIMTQAEDSRRVYFTGDGNVYHISKRELRKLIKRQREGRA